MTAEGPDRFRLLATFVAGRSVDVATANVGDLAHTDGRLVYVSAGVSVDRQRREVLVQSALLGAGSLHSELLRACRGRPKVARRYLAIEGRRVLADLVDRIPTVDDGHLVTARSSATSADSLREALSRAAVADAPDWFGVIKPSQITVPDSASGRRPTDEDFLRQLTAADDDGDQDGEPAEKSRILKLFETPISMSDAMSNLLRNLLGTGASSADGNAAGGPLHLRSVRRGHETSPSARPLPTQIRFSDREPGATLGVGGGLVPGVGRPRGALPSQLVSRHRRAVDGAVRRRRGGHPRRRAEAPPGPNRLEPQAHSRPR